MRDTVYFTLPPIMSPAIVPINISVFIITKIKLE